MSIRFPLFASLIALSAGAAMAQESPKHLLRMAYEVGKTTWYLQEFTMQQQAKIGERKVENTIDSGMQVASEMLSVDGGRAKVRRTFLRITAKMAGMMRVDYDSDKADSKPGPFRDLSDLVGESVTLAMTDRGKVDGVELSPNFPEHALAMLGSDIKEMFSQAVPELPDQPIAIGDTWETQQVFSSGQAGGMTVKIVNRLAEVGDGRARIDQSLTVIPDAGKMPAGASLTADAASGTTQIDLATGMPIESRMSIAMHVKGSPGAPMDMQMTMSVRVAKIDAPAPKAADGNDAKKAEPKADTDK